MITAFGTPASEFAYFGIPAICIYNNPYTAYNFTKTANSIEEYKHILNNLDAIKVTHEQEEVLEYYYMQHIYFMNGRESDYLKFIKYKGDTYSDEFLKDYLPLMDNSYFEMLDSSIREGFQLVEWEQKQINLIS